MTDHQQLGSLVAERAKGNCAIEVCKRCLGYLKTFTTLRGCAPATVMPEDLAGVEYDLAAAARGYRRPAGTGYALCVPMADDGCCSSFAES